MSGTIIYAGLFELPDEDAAAHRVHGIGKILRDNGYGIIFHGLMKGEHVESNSSDLSFVALPYPQNGKAWLKLQIDSRSLVTLIQETDNLQCVILYNYPSFPFGKIRKACMRGHIPIIADITEWYHSTRKERFSFLKNIATYKRMHYDNKRVNGQIVISTYLENYYSKYNTIRIPPVFDYREIRREGSEKHEETRFVYTGSITQQKEGIEEIVSASIEMSRQRSDFVVDIFGVSIDQFLRSFPQYAANIESSNVVFHGRVNHSICLDAIRRSDFQIFVREKTRVTDAGFSTKFAESFACGTPVITTKTSNMSDYLVDGENGFWIDNNDVLTVMRRACNLSLDEKRKMKEKVQECQAFDFIQYEEKVYEWFREIQKNEESSFCNK